MFQNDLKEKKGLKFLRNDTNVLQETSVFIVSVMLDSE